MVKSKTLKTALLLLIFSLNMVSFAIAEETETEAMAPETPAANYKGFGMTAGFMSGLGFTYRHFFADKYGFKASGIGFFDRNQAFGNIGLQGMVVLSENDWLRFYALAGVSNFTTRRSYQTYDDYYYATPARVDEDEYNRVVIPPRNSSNFEMLNNFGAGIGIELGRQALGLSLALELPLVLSFRNYELNFLYPIPQISLIYNF